MHILAMIVALGSRRISVPDPVQARCTHNKVTPRGSKKNHDDEAGGDCSTRRLPEPPVASPIILPRKRRVHREVQPRKLRRIDSLERERHREDTFRGRISVKIPAWMTETLKTIPAFLSPKRDREARALKAPESVGESSAAGAAVPDQNGETTVADAPEGVVVGSTDDRTDYGVVGGIPLGNGLRNGCDAVGPETAESAALNIVVHEEAADGESLGEDVISHDQHEEGIRIEQEQQPGGGEEIELREPSDEAEGVENEEQLDEMTTQNTTDSTSESITSIMNSCAPAVQGTESSLVPIDEASGTYPAKQRPPGYSKSYIMVDEGSEDSSDNHGSTSTEQSLPTKLIPEIIVISDDEGSDNESEAGQSCQRPHYHEQTPQKPAGPKATRILTPESLPSAQTPPKAVPSKLLNRQAQSTALPRTPPSGARADKSRWSGHRRAPYSRFSGPRIFTPLTLHPIEPGMGLVDMSRWPQHEESWGRSTKKVRLSC